jgi:hypothetical protein
MRRFAIAVATAVVALALGGCAASADGPASSSPAPSGTSGPPSTHSSLAAAWVEDGRAIGVVTWGSSSCVPVGNDASVAGDVIHLRLSDAAGETACTSDLGPRVTLVRTPDGVDPAKDYRVQVIGAGVQAEAALAGVTGLGGPSAAPTDGPTAGWTADDGLFVIVTYGSGCRPQVEDAAATADAEVTVTFAVPPAGQVCTMSYGPRGSVATVTGLKASANVTAVLNGDGLEDVRVPIAGTN